MLKGMARIHRNCQACSTLFAVEPRNSERQRFCPKPDCQQERRREAQRLRRATVLERLCSALLKDDPMAARGPQAASRIPEGLIDSQSPVLIGLISMLIDSEDREEISIALQKLWQRGLQILDPQLTTSQLKRLERKAIDKAAAKAQTRE